MPQVLKPEVRERILAAALAAFARGGFANTTMNEIARDAGMAVANLYRYFASKDELFDAAVPHERVARFEQLLERSVQAHARLAGLAPGADAAAAAELLDFWLQHRLLVIILLDRAQGSVYEPFAARFVERLATLSIAQIRSAYPGVVVHRPARLVLTQIFENTRRMIAAILESSPDEAAIRRAVAAFRSYQLGGLSAFTRWLVAEGPGRGDRP